MGAPQFYLARPPLVSIKNPRTTHTLLARETYNRVAELAIERQLSVSTLIRQMVEDYLERHPKTS